MTQCPQTSPLSWSTTRYGYCLRQTTPHKESGMFLNLRKNLSQKLRDPKKYQEDQEKSARYYAYVQLLNRQKPVRRTFTGHFSDSRTHARTAREVSDRLHKAISVYQPAESRPQTAPPGNHALVNKPVYSRPEISAIFDKLASRFDRSKSRRSSRASQDKQGEDKAGHEETGSCNSESDTATEKENFMKRFRKRQLYYPADEVSQAIEEYIRSHYPSQSDASKRGIRPFSARSYAHSDLENKLHRDVRSCEKKPTENEMDCTTDRLNAQREVSPSSERKSRRVKSAPPDAEKSHRHRQVSERELDTIIARLTTYDKERWPPESKGHC